MTKMWMMMTMMIMICEMSENNQCATLHFTLVTMETETNLKKNGEVNA